MVLFLSFLDFDNRTENLPGENIENICTLSFNTHTENLLEAKIGKTRTR